MEWQLRATTEYLKLAKKRTDLQKKLASLEERLPEDPYHVAHSHRMRQDWKGVRSVRITGNWRLYYTICAECREFSEEDVNRPRCPDCGDQPDETINLLTVDDPH